MVLIQKMFGEIVAKLPPVTTDTSVSRRVPCSEVLNFLRQSTGV